MSAIFLMEYKVAFIIDDSAHWFIEIILNRISFPPWIIRKQKVLMYFLNGFQVLFDKHIYYNC